jgi:hypothetical protein
MEILNASNFINEKLDIKPITKTNLGNVRNILDKRRISYDDVCNMKYPKTQHDLIKAVAVALITQGVWYPYNFEIDYFCVVKSSITNRCYIDQQKEYHTDSEWFVDIEKNIYPYAIQLLMENRYVIGKRNNMNALMPAALLINKARRYDDPHIWDYENVEERLDDLSLSGKSVSLYIRSDYVPKKYEYCCFHSEIASDSKYPFKYPSHDINGNEIKYAMIDWHQGDRKWYISTDMFKKGETVLSHTDVIQISEFGKLK